MTVKEEGRQFTEVFKSVNVPNPDRRYIRHVHFLRDPRTGLHGLVVFKNDSFQIWSCSGYESGLKAALNKDVRLFPTTPVDIRVFGRGSDLYMIATSAVSTVYIVQLDAESERLKVEKKPLKNVLFVRPLPDRSGFVAVTKEAKLAKYSPDGEPLNTADIPDRMIPKSFAVSPNGKLAAMGGGRAELLIFDLESMELQHKIEAGYGAISQLAFTADGNGILVSGEQTVVRLFTLEDLGSAMPWVQSRQFAHHTAKVVALATVSTPEGEQFATSSIDGEVCLWSLRNEEPLHVHRLSQEAATALNLLAGRQLPRVGHGRGQLAECSGWRTTRHSRRPRSSSARPKCWRTSGIWKGPTVFEPQPLRKFLGIFKDDGGGDLRPDGRESRHETARRRTTACRTMPPA
ncbi:hypothetical protein M3Y99_00959400 [Aphelenchoides fujianensis]|nr:hypothetical protein M3Y99_00959400 [Aphelenchoides fujianensis]